MQSLPNSDPGSWTFGVRLDPEKLFDANYYLSTYLDLRSANVDPLFHFIWTGSFEDRNPNSWFQSGWYKERYLSSLESEKVSAFHHFCYTGNLLGLSPNPAAETRAVELAKSHFDPKYYLQEYLDVANSGVDPWSHYLWEGWKEGRNPSRTFNATLYRDRCLEQIPKDDYESARKLRFNVVLHYGQLDQAGTGQIDHLSDALQEPRNASDDLIAYLQSADTHSSNGSILSLSDFDLVLQSSLFDCEVFSFTTHVTGSRTELVTRYLTDESLYSVDCSAEFSGAFYRAHYENFKSPLREGLRSTGNPLVHFLRFGRRAGFYTNPRTACLEIATIRSSGQFDASFYLSKIGRPSYFSDAVADYAIYGHLSDIAPSHQFQGAFVKLLYGSISDLEVRCPLAFFIINCQNSWVYNSPHDLLHDSDLIRNSRYFDSAYYSQMAGLEDSAVDLATHFAVVGTKNRLPASSEFDTDYYLSSNRDLLNAPVNPLIHFELNGRAEGRFGCSHFIWTPGAGLASYDKDRPTVIVFSHEASRTGAPIVALNIVRQLSANFNVITWLGKKSGPLIADFASLSVELLKEWGSTKGIIGALERLMVEFGCKLAFVNSVVCHPVLPALAAIGMARVSLIHEFANYVYPPGTLSRMMLYSDHTVFPATIVRQAAFDESTRIGAARHGAYTSVRPQGYNTANESNPDTSADDLKKQLALQKGSKVLLGAGAVSARKGLDVFFQVAHRLASVMEYDWRFVWVGAGFDPVADVETSMYIWHQIKESGISDRVFFFGEQNSLDPFWSLSDVFLLSSRLDPFPNVALDAVFAGVPVVCFAGSTGVAELESAYPFAVRAVTYMDVLKAASAITTFLNADECSDSPDVSKKRETLLNALSFDAYVEHLLQVGEDAKITCERYRHLASTMRLTSEVDVHRFYRVIPESFRAPYVGGRDIEKIAIAHHIHNGSLLPLLKFDETAGVISFDRAPSDLLGPTLGSLSALPTPAEHIIHMHCDDVEMVRVLIDDQFWTGRLLAGSSVVLTAPTRAKAAALLRLGLPSRTLVIDKLFPDGLEALHYVSNVSSVSGFDAQSASSISSQTITHLRLSSSWQYRAEPKADVVDCLLCLFSGATLNYLHDNPRRCAVTPENVVDHRSAGVKVVLKSLMADAEIGAGSYSHALCGTFRRDTLLEFCRVYSQLIRSAGRALSLDEQGALTGLVFDETQKSVARIPRGSTI